jgi:hypothetical protein
MKIIKPFCMRTEMKGFRASRICEIWLSEEQEIKGLTKSASSKAMVQMELSEGYQTFRIHPI